jgi:protein-L-isoaspartate(D-aspartate) O-methyltransferase
MRTGREVSREGRTAMKKKHRRWIGPIAAQTVLFVLAACAEEKQAVDSRLEDHYDGKRMEMVEKQIEARGVKNPRVLEALRKVPRHRFVRKEDVGRAYQDSPLPIGHNQTISQPYIVGLMTSLLDPQPDDVVLEIGTGSGYQAAVLAELVRKVYTIEIVRPLGEHAREVLHELEYENVEVKIGDGYQGWPEHAPFDGVIVTAAPSHIPQPLIDQLKDGARLVIPVGDYYQELQVVKKKGDLVEVERSIAVRFVPMTGEAEER